MFNELNINTENDLKNLYKSQFILLPDGINHGITSGLVLHDLVLGIEDCIFGSINIEYYKLSRSSLIVAEAIHKRMPEFNPGFTSSPQKILQLALLRSKMAETERIHLEEFFPKFFNTLGLHFTSQNAKITSDVLPIIYPFLNDPEYSKINDWVNTFQNSISNGMSSFFQIDGFDNQSGLHFIKDFLRNSIRLSKSGKFLRNIMHVPDEDQLEDTAKVFKFLEKKND